ncbi:MAG TPA: PIG-L family deacetylase [Acidimicrobiales bacterium]|jgi:LmbE family N-acetylglucosaminyl deacetylase|nr:PIG-L family deacetylase [Acidimicrobiales bacterium]
MPASPRETPPLETLPLETPKRALAIGAHPDDVEFGCGGTLAKWAAAGCSIHHLVCTDGSKGSWDPAEDTARLVALRQEEQRAASRALGGKGEVVFLGWPDGELESGLRQRWEVAYWIRVLQPDVVLGHDPWKRYRLHPDHRNAGLLAVEGIVAARDPHFFPEQQVPPWRPSALLLWEADEPDHVEDVAAFVDAKFAALLEHRSQLRSTMHVDDEGDAEQVASFRAVMEERLAEHGALAGLPFGEAFKLITRL